MVFIGNCLGIALLGVGVLWMAQAYGVVPGSFLFNEFPWGPRGPVSTVSGIVLLLIINFGGPRRR